MHAIWEKEITQKCRDHACAKVEVVHLPPKLAPGPALGYILTYTLTRALTRSLYYAVPPALPLFLAYVL